MFDLRWLLSVMCYVLGNVLGKAEPVTSFASNGILFLCRHIISFIQLGARLDVSTRPG